MRYQLDERESDLYGVGGELAREFGPDYWRQHARDRAFPRELWVAIGERGHLGTLVPADRGGAGGSLLDLTLVSEGLAAAGLPILTLITGPGLALPAIARAGSTMLRSEVLPGLLSGTQLVGFAITEAAAGSNVLRIETRAELVGDEIVVRGTKLYTSIADIADHIMVVARTQEPVGDRLGFTLVVVPRDCPGLTITPIETTLSCPERQCRLSFDDVRLRRDHLVGEPARGLQLLAPALAAERVLQGALSCGIGQYCIDRAREFTLDRKLYRGPIAALQGVQHPLAEVHAGVAGARHLVRHAAVADDEGDPGAVGLASTATFAAGLAGWRAADTALQCLGGRGYTVEGELHVMAGLARLLRSAPVNAQAALSAIGELVLGMPRSY